MNIGIDARNVTDKSSGLVGYVKNLVYELSKLSGLEIFVFSQAKYKHVFNSLERNKNFHIKSVYFNNKFLDFRNFLYEQLQFHRVINKCDLDIFHSPFGFGVPSKVKSKVVLTIHDLIPLSGHDQSSFIQLLIYRKSLRIALDRADQIVTISEFTKKELRKFYPGLNPEKVCTIYNGFDRIPNHFQIDKIFPRLKQEMNITDKYILYVGSAVARKNLLNLTRAFAELKKKEKVNHKIVFVSKFDRDLTKRTYFQILHFLRSKNLENEAIFPPRYINDNERAALMKHSEFVVYPSLYEGFGVPILEAMNLGKAVTCSDISVFHELYKDSVFYFNPENYKSIYLALSKLVQDEKLRHSLALSGFELQKNFSWEKMAEEYMDIYRSLHNES